MAKFNTVGIDEIMQEIKKMSDKAVKKIPKMLEAGAAVLVEAQQKEVDEMIAKGLYHKKGYPTRVFSSRSLGDLKNSIAATAVKETTEDGKVIYVYPQGKDSDGTSNNDKGFSIEYGTSATEAYPWMEQANAKAEAAVIEAEKKVWEADDG